MTRKEEIRKLYILEPKSESKLGKDLSLLRGLGEIIRGERIETVIGDFEEYPAIALYCKPNRIKRTVTVESLEELQCRIIKGDLKDYNRLVYIPYESKIERIRNFAEFLSRNGVLGEVRQIY